MAAKASGMSSVPSWDLQEIHQGQQLPPVPLPGLPQMTEDMELSWEPPGSGSGSSYLFRYWAEQRVDTCWEEAKETEKRGRPWILTGIHTLQGQGELPAFPPPQGFQNICIFSTYH